MEPREPPPNVFAYLDARQWLRDYYEHQKRTARGFSYRAFSRRAKLKSPNYLKLVIDGDRNLTPEMAHRFAGACRLSGDGLNYFVDLVAFTQAKSTDEKMARYERLIRFREHRVIHKIDIAYGQYHSRWYVPAIRELTFRHDFRDDPAWVAAQLLPAITEREAAEALQLLRDLELVAERDGRLVPSEALVTTGPEIKGLLYRQYHRTLMTRAAASLDELPPTDRDISSVTLCLGPGAMGRMKERIRAFRRELLQASADEAEPARVIQVNFQIFPLTREPLPPGDDDDATGT
ncbi:MAG: TIGR02147 family protein [Myxococcota bacterium]